MMAFFSALRFLTPLPVPESWCGGERGLRQSAVFFPVVGLLIGAVAAAAGYGLDYVLPAFPASVLIVVVPLVCSGGLHVDGLADTADGFFSARSRERILVIMRDSRTGAMGVVAVAVVVLLKVALLTAIPGPERWRVVLLMPLAGRVSFLPTMALLPYARPEGGLATVFGTERWRATLNALWAVALLLAAGWMVSSVRGLIEAGASCAVALLFAAYCRRKIGGYTGDTLGATSEVVELVPALVAAIWLSS
ncbi:MAG: adenosylcobinamide-GDP ribazoletransferase [Thermoleophilia bacterium]|nr:adenosylcobinamide-GDP ribazoletransferase [Thermoleophilia bacterium]